MGARRGQLESDTSAESKGRVAPARRYASFVVRGWLPGATGTLEIAHEQSGERITAASMSEAIGWMQARAGAAARSQPGEALSPGCSAEGVPSILLAKGGEWQALSGAAFDEMRLDAVA
jgi:hypothetical protein